MSLISELKRRNVLRVAVAYLAAAWLLIQIVETLFPLFGLSDALVRILVIVLSIGFPIILVFSWIYELTPDGLTLDSAVQHSAAPAQHSAKRLDRAIIVVLTLAVGFFAVDKFVVDPARDAQREQAVAQKARNDALIESYGDKSIAVLPFLNMSSDQEQEYFSDGISEELLNLLAKIRELRVISRSSSFAFKGKDIEIRELAAQLNVAHILEGSVRRAGDRVRITAQLIDAQTDTHLWSETYDRRLTDIFATQDEIAAAVVTQLKLTLLGGNALSVRQTDPEAYALFLQARHIRLLYNPAAYEQALELYEQSLAIDPDYPPALEGFAEILVLQSVYGLRPVDAGYREARAAINRALDNDPEFGVAVAGLGWIAVLYDHDLAAAARHFERALALDPTDLDIIQGVSYLADAIGHLDTAVAFREYAVAHDPAGPVRHMELASSYLKARRYEDAAAVARTGVALRPGQIGASHILGAALMANGDLQAALEAMQNEAFDAYRISGLSMVYFELGEYELSDEYLDKLIDQYGDDAAIEVANVYARRADADNAFQWLEKGLQNNDSSLSSVAFHYSFWNVNRDPRWQAFLSNIGKSDAQLSTIEFDVKPPR